MKTNEAASIVLKPIKSEISITPNNKGIRQDLIEDDDACDGFYYMDVEYILDRPNLFVNARIECENELDIGHMYVSELGIVWIPIDKNVIINRDNFMDSFVFPSQLVHLGSCFPSGTGSPD